MKFIDLTIEVIDLSRDESESNSESTEEECCICYEVLSQGRTIKLECGHTYHTKCMKKWAEKPCQRRCPLDRQLIQMSELYEINRQDDQQIKVTVPDVPVSGGWHSPLHHGGGGGGYRSWL